MIFNKRDQYQTVYDSYDVQLAAKYVQLLALENASTTFSLTGQLEYNVLKEDDKHWLYQMFVAYCCEECSTTPLTQHKYIEIKQELTKEKNYFGDNSNESLYIDMRRSKGYTDELEKLTHDDGGVTLTIKLKNAATKKMRLRIIAYSQAEYWYTSTNKGHIMTHKGYSIAKDEDIAAQIVMRKRKYRKRTKRDQGKPYIRKNKFYFEGRRPYLRKNKIYFGEGIKRIQRGDGIFGTILMTAPPLVGETVKAFK